LHFSSLSFVQGMGNQEHEQEAPQRSRYDEDVAEEEARAKARAKARATGGNAKRATQDDDEEEHHQPVKAAAKKPVSKPKSQPVDVCLFVFSLSVFTSLVI
jgi:hypothetical protein